MTGIFGFQASPGCTGGWDCPLGVEVRKLRGIRFVVIDHSAHHHGRIIWGRARAEQWARDYRSRWSRA